MKDFRIGMIQNDVPLAFDIIRICPVMMRARKEEGETKESCPI